MSGTMRALVTTGVAAAAAALGPAPAVAGSLDLVGYNPLEARGLNSTIAISKGHAYVGSFGDSSRPDAGVGILSLANPTAPQAVGLLPARPGQGSTEVRAWPRRDLLIVLAPRCDPFCADPGAARPQLLFYDIAGVRATDPALLGSVELPADPEELYLWQDPRRPNRALLYVTTVVPGAPNILAYDLSGARAAGVRLVDDWTLPPSAGANGVHTLSVSADGRVGYAAAFDAGYFLLSTKQLAKRSAGAEMHLLTPLRRRIRYPGVNGHSAIELPGSRLALISDEIYGCPWGWARVLDVADLMRPRVIAQMRVPPYNEPSLCRASNSRDAALLASTANQTFSAHDLTATCDLMLASWYGSGLQAFSLAKPRRPRRTAAFIPTPLSTVQAEDPLLLGVEMHSHPTISGGLIYVVDIRSGLFVLRYRGPHQRQVSRTGYLAGNSNLSRGLKSLPSGGRRCGRTRSSSGHR
jgi:hypothetical protein